MPLISVIIPVYNGENTIRQTLQSVLDQTCSDFELIIINDGSKDATLDVIASFSDPRIKIFSYENAGLSASRNRGISHATGTLVSFLDADDLWSTDKLAAQYEALQTHPHAAVAYSWTDYINEAGEFLYSGCHMTASGNVYKELFVKNFIENGSNPLIRKDALAAVGAFDCSLPAAEDWDMWLRLAAQYHFVAVSTVQIFYRISTLSMSADIIRQEQACLVVLERALSQAPIELQPLKRSSFANLYQYLAFKSLTGQLTRQKSFEAGRCLLKALLNDPALLQKRTRLMAIVSLKIVSGILLPGWVIPTLKHRFKTTHNSQSTTQSLKHSEFDKQ